jgi:large subunit ribosomal protein L31e
MKVNESRVYIVPLRKGFLPTPRWRRSKRAMRILRQFILKHTKAEKVIISKWINEEIWANGGRNPPGKIKVKVVLKEEDKIRVAHTDLDVLPARSARVKQKAEKKLSLKEKLKAKLAKTDEAPTEDKEEKKKAKVTKAQELKMKK